MPQTDSHALICSGSSHPELAIEIAESAGIKLGEIDIQEFPDGEIAVQLHESVRGGHLFIVQSIARDPHRYLMELLLIVDAAKRASARHIVAIIPYFGYARQDRRDRPRVPISAKLVADLLTAAGVTQVVTMDLHTEQLQGFFNIPVDSLHARSRLIEAFRKQKIEAEIVVATPDVGSVKLARAYANDLGTGMVIVDKDRIDATQVKTSIVIGDVKGKDVLLADDMCSTGGTLVSAAKACQEKGARRVFAVISHGLFVGDSVERIRNSPIEALIVSNTIPANEAALSCGKILYASVAPVFGRAIQGILAAESISSLCHSSR